MPKESFEQFVKRQEERLEKAEKMVEEVEREWKKEIEEFEIEKPVKELKKLWEENEEEVRRERKKGVDKLFSFFLFLPLPEIPLFLLERISNKFLKEFDWKKFEKKVFLDYDLGLFLSAFLNKNIENYILSQKKKGIKEEDIKPIEVHLNVEELPIRLSYLGYRNPEKLHLIIEGNCEGWTGQWMQGGKMIIEGNCGDWTGEDMQGGELNIKGKVVFFDKSAFSSGNQGIIIWRRTKIWEKRNWTKDGEEMWKKLKIPAR
ncbi:hypothetical protein J7J37_01685 [bacterium]|nr:hypothetical protein [bacterium]